MPAKVVYRGRHVVVAFEMNRQGIAAFAMNPQLRRVVTSVVLDRALPYALGLAQTFRRTGDYASHFVVTETSVVISGRRRVATELANDSDHSAAVEFGNARVRNPHRPLRRTLEHLQRTHVV